MWCVGIGGAKNRLLAELSAARDLKSKGVRRRIDRARKAAVAAVYFNVKEAVTPLRSLLDLRSPSERSNMALQINGLRAEAAYALAHLGDQKSSQAIVRLIRWFETHGHGSLWSDTLEALEVLDSKAAARYSTTFPRQSVALWNQHARWQLEVGCARGDRSALNMHRRSRCSSVEPTATVANSSPTTPIVE